MKKEKTMNKDKALKLALDYLTGNIAGHLKGLADQKAEAITALRQSIEQAEQAQPVAKPLCKVGGMPAPGRMCPKVIVGGKLCGFTGECEHKQVTTSPPPRQPWVGLTDEQWKQKLGDRQLFTILEAIRFVETVYGIKGEA
jgi:hypothetical protein